MDDVDILHQYSKNSAGQDVSRIVLVVTDPGQSGVEGKNEASELAEWDEEGTLRFVHPYEACLEVEDYPGHGLERADNVHRYIQRFSLR